MSETPEVVKTMPEDVEAHLIRLKSKVYDLMAQKQQVESSYQAMIVPIQQEMSAVNDEIVKIVKEYEGTVA